MGERRKRDERRAQRRLELLEAAVGAVREHGPGATMEQLAAAGGVTKPILYRHFGDREGLIAAIAERFAKELLAEVEQPLTGEQGTEARVLLESTVEAYVRFIANETHLYRFLVQRTSGGSPGRQRVEGLVDTIAKEVALIIGERLRAVGADAEPALVWSYGIIGFVHQASDWWLHDRSLPRDELVRYLTGLLWNGLSHASDATGAAARAVAGPGTAAEPGE